MTAAVFGLLGVIVGALLTGTVSWLQEQARSRAEFVAECRLMADDLREACLYVFIMRREGVWSYMAPSMVKDTLDDPHDRWYANRRILAKHLSSQEFVAVSHAYSDGLRMLRGLYGEQFDERGESEKAANEFTTKLLLGFLVPGLRVFADRGSVDYTNETFPRLDVDWAEAADRRSK